MTINMVFAVIFLLGIWILLRFLYPQLVIDIFRDNLFKIRNKMFDLVLSKEINSFDLPAYRAIEDLINGLIHYSEKIRPSLVVAIFLCSKEDIMQKMKNEKHNLDDNFNKVLSQLNDIEKKTFIDLRAQVEMTLGIYVVFSSVTTTLMFFCLIVVLSVVYLFGKLFNTSKTFKNFVLAKFFASLKYVEVSALLSR